MQGVIVDNNMKERVGNKVHLWKNARAIKIVVVGDRDLAQGQVTVQNGCDNISESVNINTDDMIAEFIQLSKMPEPKLKMKL